MSGFLSRLFGVAPVPEALVGKLKVQTVRVCGKRACPICKEGRCVRPHGHTEGDCQVDPAHPTDAEDRCMGLMAFCDCPRCRHWVHDHLCNGNCIHCKTPCWGDKEHDGPCRCADHGIAKE